MSDSSGCSSVYINRPFVNVLKKYNFGSWKKIFSDGTFTSHKDPHLKSTVHTLTGSTPGSNYVHLPKFGHQGLILRGRYFYLNFYVDPSKDFSFSLDCRHVENASKRISVSTSLLGFCVTPVGCQVPIAFRSSGSRKKNKKLSKHGFEIVFEDIPRWTTLCLDLDLIADLVFQARHEHIRALRISAEVTIGCLFTSDYLFVPEHLLSEVVTPLCYRLPTEMSFPLEEDQAWKDSYGFVCFPQNVCTEPNCRHGKQDECSPDQVPPNDKISTSSPHIDAVQTQSSPTDSKPLQEFPQHQPMLQLERALGFGGANKKHATMDRHATRVVYPCNAILVLQDVCTGVQQFMIGHTNKISCLTADTNFELLASAESGDFGLIRIWCLETLEPLVVLRPNATYVSCLSISRSGQRLCCVGKDIGSSKNVVIVWDIGDIRSEGGVKVVCRGHTDAHIVKMTTTTMVVDDDFGSGGRLEERMVSCGHGNVRLWRTRGDRLKSTSVNLSGHHEESFVDVAFECHAEPSEFTEGSPESARSLAYAVTKSCLIFEVDCINISIVRVIDFRGTPLTNRNLPMPNTLLVTQNYICLGGSCGGLSLWTRDASLELFDLELQGSIELLAASNDCTKILIGRNEGSLGVFDLKSRQMSPVQSAMGVKITKCSLDGRRSRLCSISEDGGVRTWDLNDLNRPMSILPSPLHPPPPHLHPQSGNGSDMPTAGAFHPSRDLLMIGYRSGSLKVFTVRGLDLLMSVPSFSESPVTSLTFNDCGSRLYCLCSSLSSSTSGTHLVMHEVRIKEIDRNDSRDVIGSTLALKHLRTMETVDQWVSLSSDSSTVALIGASRTFVSVRNALTLYEIKKIEMSEVTKAYDWRMTSSCSQVIFACNSNTCLIIQSTDGFIYTYDYIKDEVLHQIERSVPLDVKPVSVSHKGVDILLLACQGIIRVHRLDDPHPIQFIGHSEAVIQMFFHRSESKLLSLGDELLIWKVSREGESRTCYSESIDEHPHIKRKVSKVDELVSFQSFKDVIRASKDDEDDDDDKEDDAYDDDDDENGDVSGCQDRGDDESPECIIPRITNHRLDGNRYEETALQRIDRHFSKIKRHYAGLRKASAALIRTHMKCPGVNLDGRRY